MSDLQPTQKVLIAIGSLVLVSALYFGRGMCTVQQKERTPGPLVVWLMSDPAARQIFELYGREFEDRFDVELELVFKDPWDLANDLRTHPERVEGQVDLVELDLFDLEEFAPLMRNLDQFFGESESVRQFYSAPLATGEFDGECLYVPWRLSWPMLLASEDAASTFDTWKDLATWSNDHQGRLMIPALDDRELFAIACSMIWSHGGQPDQPDSEGVRQAFEWFSDVSQSIAFQSSATRAIENSQWTAGREPDVFFMWPEGVIPLIKTATVPMDLKPYPLPCGHVRQCGVFAFGRYLAIPKSAPHSEDAFIFFNFMTARKVQNEVIFASPWLPIRSDGWGELGTRKEAYSGFSERSRHLGRPPRDLPFLTEALAETVREVLFEGVSADEAVEAYEIRLGKD